MLRALGIAFIICTFLFGLLLVVGLGWWAISSGNVRITRINDQPAEQVLSPAPTAHAFRGEELLVPTEIAAQPRALPPEGSQPFRFASTTAEPVAPITSAPLDEPAKEVITFLKELESATLIDVIGIDNGNARSHFIWAADARPEDFHFPSTIEGVVV